MPLAIADHRFTMSVRAAVLISLLLVCEAKEGESCSSEGEARCDGNARMLMCAGGSWTAVACGGPAGCTTSGRYVDCDESRAAVGDPCGPDAQGNAACSLDGKQSLECREGRWQAAEECPGPAGCTVSSDRRFVDCDGADELFDPLD